MGLFDTPSEGFVAQDFDVYREECWSSNLHNLQRMKTKEKLVKLVKNAGLKFDAVGVDISSSSEIPSVWNGRQVQDQLVYFSRDRERQKRLQTFIAREFDLAERIKSGAEHERHLILFARIDAASITIGLRLTRYSLVDNRNLRARLMQDETSFRTLLDNAAKDISLNDEELTVDGLVQAVDTLSTGALGAVELRQSWDRDQVIGLGTSVDETLTSVITACATLFKAVLWTEENDHLKLVDTLAALSEEVSASVERTTQQREAKAEQHAQRAAQARERTEAKVAAEAAWRKAQRTTPQQAEVEKKTGHRTVAHEERRTKSRSSIRASSAKASERRQSSKTQPPNKTGGSSKTKKRARTVRKEPKKAWMVGDECTLTRGLFMGKRGEVVEKPKGGYVKVKVGVIEVSVSVLELDL